MPLASLTSGPAPGESGNRKAIAKFLSANLFCAILGFVQTIVVVRLCGPTAIGVAGVLAAVSHLIINLVDVRVGDLAASLLSSSQLRNSASEVRAVMRNGFTLQLGLIGVVLALSFPLTLGYVLWNREYAVESIAVVAVAASIGALGYANGYLVNLHRLLLDRRVLIRAQVLGAVLSSVAIVGFVVSSPTATGIILGTALGALLQVLISLFALESRFAGTFVGVLKADAWRAALRYGWSHRSFLWASNLYGYARSLHRGIDVVVVSLFCSPTVTGLYKFARGTTDNLSIFVDALNKHFYPDLLQWARSTPERIKSFSRQSVRFGAGVAIVVIVGEVLLLEPLVRLVFGPAMVDAVPALILFTLSYLLMGSVNLWLWPWVVAQRRLGLYARGAFIGAIFAQYGLPFCILIFGGVSYLDSLSESAAVALFAAAHVLVYPIQYTLVARRLLAHPDASQPSGDAAVGGSSKASTRPLGRLFMVVFELDLDSQVLRWQHELLARLAEQSDEIVVLTERVGRCKLPTNVRVVTVPWFFQKLPFRWCGCKLLLNFRLLPFFLRGFDTALYHMNFSWLYRLMPLHIIRSVPTLMWYAHGSVTRGLLLAHELCDQVITSSRDGFRVPSQKVSIIGQGVDVAVYNIVSEPSRKFRVLSVGRLSRSKNVDRIIRAFAIFLENTHDKEISLTVVGEEPSGERQGYRAELEQLTHTLGIADRVAFTGKLAPDRIATLYREALLHINLSETGSMDKTVLEALAAGCPVLTSNPAYEGLLRDIPGAFLSVAEPSAVAVAIFEQLAPQASRRVEPERLRALVVEGQHHFDGYCARVAHELIKLRNAGSTEQRGAV